MRRILTLFISLHWMVAFGALSASCAGGKDGYASALHALGIASARLPVYLQSPIASAAFTVAFGLVALLFLWTVLTAVFDDEETGGTDEVARLAFGSAVGLVTMMFITCAAVPVKGLYEIVALELAALAGSWLALSAERQMLARQLSLKADAVHVAARHMALGAAHSNLLRRLHGQGATPVSGSKA